MKIRSPLVTLLVGVVIAVVVLILSVRANETAPSPYSGAIASVGAATPSAVA